MKRVVIGLLGTKLDSGFDISRWDGWRPTVSLFQHEDLLWDRLELLAEAGFAKISERVLADVRMVSPETVARLAETQQSLLRRGLELCKNGGLVVYSVCTFTRQETVETVNAVLSEGLCEPEDGPELLAPWKTAQGQYQTDPLEGALDAFFLMRLRKRS